LDKVMQVLGPSPTSTSPFVKALDIQVLIEGLYISLSPRLSQLVCLSVIRLIIEKHHHPGYCWPRQLAL
jgi:hypothetical protein